MRKKIAQMNQEGEEKATAPAAKKAKDKDGASS
jgi:hypothetical protein